MDQRTHEIRVEYWRNIIKAYVRCPTRQSPMSKIHSRFSSFFNDIKR